MSERYERLGTKEENKIYKLAKIPEKLSRNF